MSDSGWIRLTTVAIENVQVAGTTQLMSRESRSLCHQEGNLALGEHPGHGHGPEIMKANIGNAKKHSPHSENIITWNAEENQHMLAINDKMGFQPHALEVSWLKS